MALKERIFVIIVSFFTIHRGIEVRAQELDLCGNNQCIPLEIYSEAAVREFFHTSRNYCTGRNQCFNRASLLLARLSRLLKKYCPNSSLKGRDGKFSSTGSVGTLAKESDDLAFKVMIRHPKDYTLFSYHVTSAVRVCQKFNPIVIDPLFNSPYYPIYYVETPITWCQRYSGGTKVYFPADISQLPPSGATYCDVVSAKDSTYNIRGHEDPTSINSAGWNVIECATYVAKECERGEQPYPLYSETDSDSDGVPDAYDQCSHTPESCSAMLMQYEGRRLGCAKGQWRHSEMAKQVAVDILPQDSVPDDAVTNGKICTEKFSFGGDVKRYPLHSDLKPRKAKAPKQTHNRNHKESHRAGQQ